MKIEIQKAKFSDLKTLKIISRKASEASHKYYQPNIVSIMHNSKHFLLDFLNPFWHIYTVTLDKKLIAFATVSFYKSWVYHIFSIAFLFQGAPLASPSSSRAGVCTRDRVSLGLGRKRKTHCGFLREAKKAQ